MKLKWEIWSTFIHSNYSSVKHPHCNLARNYASLKENVFGNVFINIISVRKLPSSSISFHSAYCSRVKTMTSLVWSTVDNPLLYRLLGSFLFFSFRHAILPLRYNHSRVCWRSFVVLGVLAVWPISRFVNLFLLLSGSRTGVGTR